MFFTEIGQYKIICLFFFLGRPLFQASNRACIQQNSRVCVQQTMKESNQKRNLFISSLFSCILTICPVVALKRGLCQKFVNYIVLSTGEKKTGKKKHYF